MRIGIDISQSVYEGTGVACYVRNLTGAVIAREPEWEYVLFGASLRQAGKLADFVAGLKKRFPQTRIRGVVFPVPPGVLEFFWNRLHIIPAEWLVGAVDVFWSSDWTQAPRGKALNVTTVHDVSVLTYPESFAGKIVSVQKRRLSRVGTACDLIFCDSEQTRRDIVRKLGIAARKLYTIYPGFTPNL